jgi:hypothetical protein
MNALDLHGKDNICVEIKQRKRLVYPSFTPTRRRKTSVKGLHTFKSFLELVFFFKTS